MAFSTNPCQSLGLLFGLLIFDVHLKIGRGEERYEGTYCYECSGSDECKKPQGQGADSNIRCDENTLCWTKIKVIDGKTKVVRRGCTDKTNKDNRPVGKCVLVDPAKPDIYQCYCEGTKCNIFNHGLDFVPNAKTTPSTSAPTTSTTTTTPKATTTTTTTKPTTTTTTTTTPKTTTTTTTPKTTTTTSTTTTTTTKATTAKETTKATTTEKTTKSTTDDDEDDELAAAKRTRSTTSTQSTTEEDDEDELAANKRTRSTTPSAEYEDDGLNGASRQTPKGRKGKDEGQWEDDSDGPIRPRGMIRGRGLGIKGAEGGAVGIPRSKDEKKLVLESLGDVDLRRIGESAGVCVQISFTALIISVKMVIALST